MSDAVTWVIAPQTEVGGSARPDYVVGPGGEGNSVAVITLTNRHHGERVAIEGRPEHLLEIAREILRTAEQIVEVTMRDPGLRSLYGITAPGPLASRLVEIDPAALTPQDGPVAESAYVVGGLDVTPDSGPYCGLENEGFTCTRSPDGHTLHAAGGGEVIVAVWEESDHAS